MASDIKKITVVCTGNSCRSPMAERLLAHALEAEGPPFSQIEVTSAGVSAFGGDPASQQSIDALKKVKLDLSDHRSRRLSTQLIDESDLLLVMTSTHKAIIDSNFPEAAPKTFLFREFDEPNSPEVPDPFGGSLDNYIETRDSLATAIPSIIKYLKSHYEN